jgi:chromosome segregation ATPase
MRVGNGEDPATHAGEERLRHLEETVAQIRDDLLRAIDAQERLHEQLRLAVDELSKMRSGSKIKQEIRAPEGTNLALQRIESRMRGIERRLEQVSEQLSGILESRIWRTLVKGGGFLMRFTRR